MTKISCCDLHDSSALSSHVSVNIWVFGSFILPWCKSILQCIFKTCTTLRSAFVPHIEQISIVSSCGVMFSDVESLWLITLIQIKLILNLDYDFISLLFSLLSLCCLLLFSTCHTAITSIYDSSTGFTQAHKQFRVVRQSLSLHLTPWM